MHPTLLRLGGYTVSSYGVALAAAFVTAVLLSYRGARRQGLDADRVLDLGFWVLVSSLLGSRLLYVVTNAGELARHCGGGAADAGPAGRSTWQVIVDCSRPLHLWEGGYVFYGGFIAASLVSLWFARRHQMSFLRLADLIVPIVALGHAIGRLGCFAAGCCYGKPFVGPFAVSFPPESLAYQEMLRDGLLQAGAAATPPLVPTQLLESAAELAIFFVLLVVVSKRRYPGQGLLAYMLLYPLARLPLEVFRGDPDRFYLVRLHTPGLNAALGLAPESASFVSTSQVIALLSLIVAGVMLLYLRRRSAGETPLRP